MLAEASIALDTRGRATVADRAQRDQQAPALARLQGAPSRARAPQRGSPAGSPTSATTTWSPICWTSSCTCWCWVGTTGAPPGWPVRPRRTAPPGRCRATQGRASLLPERARDPEARAGGVGGREWQAGPRRPAALLYSGDGAGSCPASGGAAWAGGPRPASSSGAGVRQRRRRRRRSGRAPSGTSSGSAASDSRRSSGASRSRARAGPPPGPSGRSPRTAPATTAPRGRPTGRRQHLGGGFLLAALDLGDVAQAHPGIGRDLAQRAALLRPLLAQTSPSSRRSTTGPTR